MSSNFYLLATRILMAALLTALVAALGNWMYELFFDPARYAAGQPIGRAFFVTVVTFPFILGGLLVLGIPATLILKRLRTENVLTYILAGALSGVFWGATVVALVVPTFGNTSHIVNAAFGSLSMLLWWRVRPRALPVS